MSAPDAFRPETPPGFVVIVHDDLAGVTAEIPEAALDAHLARGWRLADQPLEAWPAGDAAEAWPPAVEAWPTDAPTDHPPAPDDKDHMP